MKVRFRKIDWENIPLEISPFLSPTEVFITPGQEYNVYALSIYKKVLFFLVVDDDGNPDFLPHIVFDIISNEIPGNWICNVSLGEEVDLVIGPDFIAKDLSSYISMVDWEPDQLERLWHLDHSDE